MKLGSQPENLESSESTTTRRYVRENCRAFWVEVWLTSKGTIALVSQNAALSFIPVLFYRALDGVHWHFWPHLFPEILVQSRVLLRELDLSLCCQSE